MASGTIEQVSKVARWGNSLGFLIPHEGVDQLKAKEGESVKMRVGKRCWRIPDLFDVCGARLYSWTRQGV
ncbi:MAG TPA: hypothetical protein VIL86_16475 [Tepidisphaeraceae bacterium]|jgi:hypothetical protein